MVKRKRNSKEEYERRIARGAAKGLSRSQARGHPRANEAPAKRTRRISALEDAKLQMGIRALRTEKSVTKAAKIAQISPERLRAYAQEKKLIKKRGRRWFLKLDLPRRLLIFSGGHERTITVDNFKAASLVGRYMSHVGWFSTTNEKSHLKKFVGKFVTDINGKSYLLETRPNVLYQLLRAGGNSFEQIYRIVV